jgi:hypothetical protein
MPADTPQGRAPVPSDFLETPRLAFAADALSDVEHLRIATEGRLRALSVGKNHYAPGRDLRDTPTGLMLETQMEVLATLEHAAVLNLQRELRQHPLHPWVKGTTGVGEKQAARLLAVIGDPTRYVDTETGEVVERTVSMLWAYCGMHVIDGKRPRRRHGEKANWSNEAKMRVRLIAESCMKQMASPYRPVYEGERLKWEERDTTDLHKHNHALGVVAKEVLKDLWREARRLRGDHGLSDTHQERVAA